MFTWVSCLNTKVICIILQKRESWVEFIYRRLVYDKPDVPPTQFVWSKRPQPTIVHLYVCHQMTISKQILPVDVSPSTLQWNSFFNYSHEQSTQWEIVNQLHCIWIRTKHSRSKQKRNWRKKVRCNTKSKYEMYIKYV